MTARSAAGRYTTDSKFEEYIVGSHRWCSHSCEIVDYTLLAIVDMDLSLVATNPPVCLLNKVDAKRMASQLLEFRKRLQTSEEDGLGDREEVRFP
jgi:hypothetical protein